MRPDLRRVRRSGSLSESLRPPLAAPVKLLKHEVRPLLHRRLRQMDETEAETRIGFRQTLVFAHRGFKAVPARVISAEDLRPGRGEEDDPIVLTSDLQAGSHRFTCREFKRCGGIHDPAVEEDVRRRFFGGLQIRAGERQGRAGEGGKVDPGKGPTSSPELPFHDTPAGLREGFAPTPRQGPKQGRLAPAGAA